MTNVNGIAQNECNSSKKIVPGTAYRLSVESTSGGKFGKVFFHEPEAGSINYLFIKIIYILLADYDEHFFIEYASSEMLTVRALSRNVTSLEITSLSNKNFRISNNLPIAFIVRICLTDSKSDCQKTPLYREVVGLYNAFANRSFVVVNGILDNAKMFAKLPNTEGDRLYAHLTRYDGGKYAESGHQVTKFEAWKQSERQSTLQSWCYQKALLRFLICCYPSIQHVITGARGP